MAIGSDIMMVLDQCVPSTADRATARAALDLTHRWAALRAWRRGAIRRSRCSASCRGRSSRTCGARARRASPRCRSTASPSAAWRWARARDEREDVCELTAEQLPHDKPRYLMGVGTPLDLLEAVHRGVDMFDCIIPTQLGAARRRLHLARLPAAAPERAQAIADEALDPDCACPTCRRYSRAYLHHLTKTRRAARLAASGAAQPLLLPPAHARDSAEHPGRHVRRPLRAKRRALLERATTSTTRVSAPGPSGPEPPALGGLRGARGPRGIREHPARGVGRDHARAHAAHGGGPSLYVEQSGLAQRLELRSFARALRTPRRS